MLSRAEEMILLARVSTTGRLLLTYRERRKLMLQSPLMSLLEQREGVSGRKGKREYRSNVRTFFTPTSPPLITVNNVLKSRSHT